MIKKRYVKRMYIEEVYCDKCGGKLALTGNVICTYPELYEYKCEKCNNIQNLKEYYDQLKYEFEGTRYDIKIIRVFVFPQCYSAIAPRLGNMI